MCYANESTAAIQALAASSRLYLLNDPYKTQPYFQLSKLIDKQVFGSNVNLSKESNVNIKIELIEKQTINEDYALHFEIKR